MEPPFTRPTLKFLERAQQLRDPSSETYHEVGFWARVWVQASLPHSDPGGVYVWGRENGDFSLTVQPGMDLIDGRQVSSGIPYGSVPRLILCWMCTEAVRKENPKLYLGQSLAEFMQAVGLGRATGGRWGSITRFKEQMKRLTQARISFRFRGREGTARRGLQLSKEEVLWWSPRLPGQRSLFRSYLVLDDAFFREIVTNPIPIKVEALRILQKSSLALDLYTWLTFRVHRLEQPVTISWLALERQLGSNYASTDEFARRCRRAIRKIQIVYPELRVEFPRGRIRLAPCSTHVPRRSTRRSLREPRRT